MAGLGRKVFTRGTLSSADVNGYLMDQTVPVFASAAARDAAIPSPSEGMHCYLLSVHRRYRYTSAGAWQFDGGEGTPTFIGLPLLTGWAAVTGRTPGYLMDSDGFVNLIGAFQNSAQFTVPPAAGMGQLPIGFRPVNLSNFAVGWTGGVLNVEISTAGILTPRAPSGQVVPITSAIGVDGIRFAAA